MLFLRQSTASQEILLGPFVDSTDGNTQETALTINNTDIKLWKEGGTTEASKNSGGATHIATGRYYAVLDATDTDTLGKLEVNVHVAGALAVRREFMVLPAMIYDSLVLGSDRFDVNVTHIADTAQTARDIGASVLLSNGTGTGQVKLASGYLAMTWADIGSPTTVVNLSGTTVKTATDVETDTQDIQARLPAALGANGNIKADVRDYNGTAGTFSSGRPEVNTSHWGGTAVGSTTVRSDLINIAGVAVSTSTAQLGVNVVNAGGTAWGSGAITAGSIANGAFDRATFAADTGLQTIRSNTAQAGAAGSITLDASADANDDFYNDCWVYLTGGTGVGQCQRISDYNGTTKEATVLPGFVTSPDNTTTFAILPFGYVDVGAFSGSTTGVGAVGTMANAYIGGNFTVNATKISGDSVAADNLEALLDGTGGVTLVASAITLTTPITANATQISGDSVAADNAESFFDGTGYAGTNNVIPTVTTATNVTTVNGLAANVITATSIAVDAVAEIQSGLSTLTAAGVRTAVGLASDNLDTQLDALPTAAEIFAAVLTTAMTEAYAADGVAPTLAQAVFLIQQVLTEMSISGTTTTIKKLDGSTTAATLTLNSAGSPTAVTRSG